MSTRQGKRFSSRNKGGGKFNLCSAQNDRSENLGKYKYQGNTTAHGDVVSGKIGVFHDGINCCDCQALGHYSDPCPKQIGTSFSYTGITLLQEQIGIPGQKIP